MNEEREKELEMYYQINTLIANPVLSISHATRRRLEQARSEWYAICNFTEDELLSGIPKVKHFPVSYAFKLHEGEVFLCLDCKSKTDLDVSSHVKDHQQAGTKVPCDHCGKLTILTD